MDLLLSRAFCEVNPIETHVTRFTEITRESYHSRKTTQLCAKNSLTIGKNHFAFGNTLVRGEEGNRPQTGDVNSLSTHMCAIKIFIEIALAYLITRGRKRNCTRKVTENSLTTVKTLHHFYTREKWSRRLYTLNIFAIQFYNAKH